MTRIRIRRRWKVLTTGILALVCIGVLFNIWFIQNTNAIIESLVSARSNGHIQLQLQRSSFQYFRKKIILRGATFYAEDTSGAKTTYQFNIPRLDLKIRSFWSFWVYRELLIDSMNVKDPEVTVTRLTKATKAEKTTVSVPEEAGRIYNSILDALEVLQVKRFQIDDGKFNLVNNIDSLQPVTTISHIHFQLNNLNIRGDSTAAQKFLYSDNVVLRVNDQDIILPDGIHHISFKNLLINVGRKQVQLDSCWVKAETKNDRNAFRIFFDVLKMANLDFAALYKKNEIKADSVYVDNPDIELALELKRKRERGKKLELDTIIQKFTGDLALGYIGVQNASVNITTNRGDTTTTFHSANDNFKMFGLRINSDSVKPVYVDEFAMILRDYETYSRDSSALYRFDSLRFNNNKVRLSNFTIQSISKGSGKPSLYYSIPAFELSGLSWEDLLFDRYISAEKAVLINPQIEYSVGTQKKKAGHVSLFKILSGLNEAIDLAAVEIKDGNLNIELPADKKLSLQHVNLALASNRLLASTSYMGMKDAIKELSFRNAVFTTGNLHAELVNLRYTNQLYADELRLTNTAKTLTAQAKGVTMNDLVWNNEQKSVFVDQLAWQQAAVVLKIDNTQPAYKKTNALIEVQHFMGANTTVTIYATDKIIKTKLTKVELDNLTKNEMGTIVLQGLKAAGSQLDVNATTFRLQGGPYYFADAGNSNMRDIVFVQQSSRDSIQLTIPQTFFKIHVADLLKRHLHFNQVTLVAPVFQMASNAPGPEHETPPNWSFPLFTVEELLVRNPIIQFKKWDSISTNLYWSATNANKTPGWKFNNIRSAKNSIGADKVQLTANKLVLTRQGKSFGVDSGFVKFLLNNLAFTNKSDRQWSAFLQEALFQNPIPLLVKNNGHFSMDTVRLRNLQLSSDNTANLIQLLQQNPTAQVNIQHGRFSDEANQVQWKDFLYSQKDRSLSVDSLNYQPALSRDSFIAKAPGQTDYMHAVLKNITVSNMDLAAFERDSSIKARTIAVNGSTLDIYRDKRKPFISQSWRPLPVLLLQKLPVKLTIDTVALKNTTITYTEHSNKTDQEGSLSINRINAQLFPVRNTNLVTNDSLTLHAEGFLMDSLWLRLRLKEAYQDSLGTFAMTLRAKPADLSVLNPVLMPLASVKIVSGQLDTATMRAIGHDYFSIGEMALFYKNLKIEFLKKGSETKKSFLASLITFAANNFVIKPANDRRTGTVYFLRNRDRSIFNFLIKTALSGVASSVGAKKNKTYYRQYKRQQKLYKLPPVELG